VRDDNPLLHLPQECAYRILFSPHIAGATAEALQAMHHSVWNNILAVTQNKRPVNIVNGR
jgi:lactate dehydrogenase-like 2-hydroxyacid dehydrogenase